MKAAAWLKCVTTPYTTDLVAKISQSINFTSGSVANVGDLIRHILRGRVFLSTRLGYVGLTRGEDTCDMGDEVWIIAGASFPVILRSVPKAEIGLNPPKHYLVRREAYVQGPTHGDAVSGISPTLPLSDESS